MCAAAGRGRGVETADGVHHRQREQRVRRGLERVRLGAEVPGREHDEGGALARDGQRREIDAPGEDPVLDVVHGVRDVVGPVHDLRLEAAATGRGAVADPGEQRGVVGVGPELAQARPAQPGVLARGVQRRAGEVEARAVDLRFEPHEDPQGLRVALEPAAGGAELVERPLAVVPERRVADVVGEAGGVDDVGVRTQLLGDRAPDLGDLERVGQPRPRDTADLGALPRPDDLRLAREPAQRGGVQYPGAVPGEGAAPAVAGGLRRLVFPTGCVVFAVVGRGVAGAQPRPVVSVSTGALVIV